MTSPRIELGTAAWLPGCRIHYTVATSMNGQAAGHDQRGTKTPGQTGSCDLFVLFFLSGNIITEQDPLNVRIRCRLD